MKKYIKIPQQEKLKTAIVASAGPLIPAPKSPDEGLGQLFDDVQRAQLYADGMTFVDLVPRRKMRQIQQEYNLAKHDPDFDLREFVMRNFYEYEAYKSTYHTEPGTEVRQHICNLWHVLERKNRRDRGSLVALPHPYIVPGGRFECQFYWDTYFVMLGLAADDKWDLIEGMIKNYAYMLRKFGFIPTANRTYFLSRSQPPFFARMVKLLARHKGRNTTLVEYLPSLLREYTFWMRGHRSMSLQENLSCARVVKMPNGTLLNRYYDNKSTPRPEMARWDEETAERAPERESDRLYLHLRAAAESGWDFSSRWFEDPADISTIHTADIVPVDLNCLLYELEMTIAEAYQVLLQPLLARRYEAAAKRRKSAICEYLWDDMAGFFTDYNFHKHARTGRFTLAAVFPLNTRIASSKQAALVAHKLEKEFLKQGGLVTTLYDTGQQWDAPNGWAPLQWVSIQGLRNYGYNTLASEVRRRWIAANLATYDTQFKLVEKYDVVHDRMGGGGEYPLQDGFGWTNGVLATLLHEENKL